MLPILFTPFVIFIKDDNNHDNLIFKHRGCSRARYKETINKCGWDKQLDAEWGGWDCEKVNNWRATRRLPHIVNRSRQSDLHTDRRDRAGNCNGFIPVIRWLASCKCASSSQRSQAHWLYTCVPAAGNSRLPAQPLKELMAEMEREERTKWERKKSISRVNASQQKMPDLMPV